MKKLLLILCVSFLPAYATYAQSHQQTLSLTLGGSFPMGSFASREAGLMLNNFAQTGLSGNISWQYLFSDRWGITAILTGSRNPIDRRALDKAYVEYPSEATTIIFGNTGSVPPPPLSGPIHPFMAHARFSAAHWLTGGLLTGIVRQWPLDASGKYTFAVKLLAGISAAQSPDYQGTGGYESTFSTLSQNSRYALAPAVLGGVSIGYELNARWAIRVGANYLTTGKFRFRNEKRTRTDIAYESTQGELNFVPIAIAASKNISTVATRISLMQLQAGVALSL